jgi:hypothetical protein
MKFQIAFFFSLFLVLGNKAHATTNVATIPSDVSAVLSLLLQKDAGSTVNTMKNTVTLKSSDNRATATCSLGYPYKCILEMKIPTSTGSGSINDLLWESLSKFAVVEANGSISASLSYKNMTCVSSRSISCSVY